MVMRTPIRVLATPSAGRAAAALADGDIGVVLYGSGRPELPGLGVGLPQAATACRQLSQIALAARWVSSEEVVAALS